MTDKISNTIILSLYEKYQNIILCLGEKYRNWFILDKQLSDSEFDKLMSNQKYVIHLTYNPEDEKFVYVVLFHTNSIYLSKTESFRKFLDNLISKIHKQDINTKQKFLEKIIEVENKQKNKIITRIMTSNKKGIETIFITKRELTTYFLRNIQSKNEKINLIVHNYLHKHFLIDISEGPLCAKHTRLTKIEAIDLLSRQLMTSAYTLPRIIINDPHIIWCGAKVGEIVKIEVNSELAGKCLRYRIVAPLSGKLQNSDILIEEEEDLEIDEEESENESENEEEKEDAILSDEDEDDEEEFY
jgi:DNA-directed RNA polymerase subunit H (RpoH/RPB5)